MAVKRSREDFEVETTAAAAANCLMLLSKVGKASTNSFDTAETSSEMSYSEAVAGPSGRVFECKTCSKKFHSFQALGGHRASHKKLRLVAELLTQPNSPQAKRKKHECSICGMEFPMGQALGGHMRRHRAELLEEKRADQDEIMTPPPLLPAVLKRPNSNSGGTIRVFGMDLSVTPFENDLKLGMIKNPAPAPAPLLVHCFI